MCNGIKHTFLVQITDFDLINWFAHLILYKELDSWWAGDQILLSWMCGSPEGTSVSFTVGVRKVWEEVAQQGFALSVCAVCFPTTRWHWLVFAGPLRSLLCADVIIAKLQLWHYLFFCISCVCDLILSAMCWFMWANTWARRRNTFR